MRNFQDTFKTRKRSFIRIFSICMTVPLTLKQFFEKLEYIFLVESTKIENATLHYKTALSEANVKTNKRRSTKGTYDKEWSSFSNYFTFSKILSQPKDLI